MGVVSPCNLTSDTVCQVCPTGFYSDFSSAFEKCRPCSHCGKSLYELYPCTRSSDVFCELCEWEQAVPNDDYRKKCLSAKKNVHLLRTGGLQANNTKKVGSKDNKGSTDKRFMEDKEVHKYEASGALINSNKTIKQDISNSTVNVTKSNNTIEPATTTTAYTGPRVNQINIDRKTYPQSTMTTFPYTGPKMIKIGARKKTNIPTTPVLTIKPGPKIAKLKWRVNTQDPAQRTTDPTVPYTGPKVRKLAVERKTHDPSDFSQPATVYEGPKMKAMQVHMVTGNPDKTTHTNPFTGPKIIRFGLKRKNIGSLKTTMKPESYTGPRVVHVGMIKRSLNPYRTTKATQTEGPRFEKGLKLGIKKLGPFKTTKTTLAYTGPKARKINLRVNKRPDQQQTQKTTPYTGPRVAKIGLNKNTLSPPLLTEPVISEEEDSILQETGSGELNSATYESKEPLLGLQEIAILHKQGNNLQIKFAFQGFEISLHKFIHSTHKNLISKTVMFK